MVPPHPLRVVGLSGPIGAGKTTLGRELTRLLGAPLVGVSDELRRIALERGAQSDRPSLADIADELWRTQPTWYLDLIVVRAAASSADVASVDAVRRLLELEALQSDPRVALTHVFITAPLPVLVDRFQTRGTEAAYLTAMNHPSETALGALQQKADLLIDSSVLTVQEEAQLVLDVL